MTDIKHTPLLDEYVKQKDKANKDGARLALLLFSLVILTLLTLVGILLIYGTSDLLLTALAVNGGVFGALYFKRTDVIMNCQAYMAKYALIEKEYVYNLAKELEIPASEVDAIIYPSPTLKNAEAVVELYFNPKKPSPDIGPALSEYSTILNELTRRAERLANNTYIIIGLAIIVNSAVMRTFGTRFIGVIILIALLFTFTALHLKRRTFFARSRMFLASRYDLENPLFATILAREVGVEESFVGKITSSPPTFLDAMRVMHKHENDQLLNQPKE